MRKYTLVKYFKGDASEKEVDSIIKWVNSSSDNKKYFAKEKAFYTSLQIPKNQNGILNNPYQRKKSIIVKLAIGISAAAALSSIFFIVGCLYGRRNSIKDSKIFAFANNQPRSLYTEKGVKGFTILPDSSKVWLNSDSKISYPAKFSGKYRTVKLSGEAYFEVTKDPMHPMIVETGKSVSVEVLGTSFNLKCYDNEDEAEATLYTGRIKLNYRNSMQRKAHSIDIAPRQTATYSSADVKNGAAPKVFSYINPGNQKAWKNGNLIFDNTSMSEVFKVLERWHGTKFIVKDASIYNHKLSAEFSSESIVQIMEIVKMIIPLNYTCNNNVVTIYSAK